MGRHCLQKVIVQRTYQTLGTWDVRSGGGESWGALGLAPVIPTLRNTGVPARSGAALLRGSWGKPCCALTLEGAAT